MEERFVRHESRSIARLLARPRTVMHSLASWGFGVTAHEYRGESFESTRLRVAGLCHVPAGVKVQCNQDG